MQPGIPDEVIQIRRSSSSGASSSSSSSSGTRWSSPTHRLDAGVGPPPRYSRRTPLEEDDDAGSDEDVVTSSSSFPGLGGATASELNRVPAAISRIDLSRFNLRCTLPLSGGASPSPSSSVLAPQHPAGPAQGWRAGVVSRAVGQAGGAAGGVGHQRDASLISHRPPSAPDSGWEAAAAAASEDFADPLDPVQEAVQSMAGWTAGSSGSAFSGAAFEVQLQLSAALSGQQQQGGAGGGLGGSPWMAAPVVGVDDSGPAVAAAGAGQGGVVGGGDVAAALCQALAEVAERVAQLQVRGGARLGCVCI